MPTSQRKTLMILGAGPMQQSAYVEARAANLQIIGIDPDPAAVSLSLSDHQYEADLADIETLLSIAEKHAIYGVMTLAADYPIPAVGRINEALGLPGINLSTAKCATDKALMKNKFAELLLTSDQSFIVIPENVPSGESRLGYAEKVRALLKGKSGFVKPIDSSGGRGITYIDTAHDIDEIKRAITIALQYSPSGRVIAEPYIDGKEFSAEIIVYNQSIHILAITEKITSGPQFFMEIGHNLPAELDNNTFDTVHKFITHLVAGMCINNSAAHLEFKIQRSKGETSTATPSVVPIEIGARLGGGYINSHLVPIATGVNIVKAAVDVAVGNQPQLHANCGCGGSAIRFLIPPRGNIHRINNMSSVIELPGIEEFSCDYQPGERIGTIRDATGRKAYVISSGKDTQEAAVRADKAVDHIEFVME